MTIKPQNCNLTPKQEQFCHEYLKTGNASEAYRAAYNTSKMKENTIWRSAKEVMDNHKVAARIAQLQAPALSSPLGTIGMTRSIT